MVTQMQQFCFKYAGGTRFYKTYEEAVKMARFLGVRIDSIKEAHIT